MKKPLRIAIILVVVLIGAYLGFRKYTKSFSPEEIAAASESGVDVKVTYSSPAKKNRLLFGREEDKALLPYGKVWRTGANEATIIEFKSDVLVGGKPVKAGQYSLFSIPGQSMWAIILNSETGQWGTEYNDGKDVLRVDVPIRIRQAVQEHFKIFYETIPNGVNMVLSWDQTEALVPITHP